MIDRLVWRAYLLFEKEATRLEDIALPETEIDEMLESILYILLLIVVYWFYDIVSSTFIFLLCKKDV